MPNGRDGVHKSWFIGEFDSRDQARQIIPPLLRPSAGIIELTTFTKSDIVRFAGAGKP